MSSSEFHPKGEIFLYLFSGTISLSLENINYLFIQILFESLFFLLGIALGAGNLNELNINDPTLVDLIFWHRETDNKYQGSVDIYSIFEGC